jgi:predicted aspartyl protease
MSFIRQSLLPFLFLVLITIITGCVTIIRQPVVQRSPLQAYCTLDEIPTEIEMKRTPTDIPIVLAETEAGKLWMLLDTGCPDVIFTPNTAARMHMTVTPVPIALVDADGRGRRINGITPVKQISLGAANFSQFIAFVSEVGNVQDHDHPPGGIAGLPLFSDCLLTIDYLNDRILIAPGSLPPPDGIDVLPLYSNNKHLAVPLQIGDREIDAIVDTGYSGTLIIPDSMKNDFPGAEKPLTQNTVRAFYSTNNMQIAMLTDDLHIGQHIVHEPIVAVSKTPMVILGAQYLKQFSITIDQTHHRIQFSRPGGKALRMPSFRPLIEQELAAMKSTAHSPTTAPTAEPTSQPTAEIDP